MGLGTDVAGGYTVDLMNAMRQGVIMSRVREGSRIETEVQRKMDGGKADEGNSLAVHWTDLLYVATRGGAEALGLSTGVFAPDVPFDAQQSERSISLEILLF